MKKLPFILVIILTMSFLAGITLPRVGGAKIAYMGFEGLTVANFSRSTSLTLNTTYQTVLAETLAFPSPKYLTGAYVVVKFYNGDSYVHTAYVELVVNGVAVWSGSISVPAAGGTAVLKAPIPLTGQYGQTFNVEVLAKATSTYVKVSSTTPPNTRLTLFAMDEDYAVNTTLISLKYIPPGAEGTSSALVLNQTEALLGTTYTLSEGAISFWLKWDGTTDIKLSDNIGIDSNGHLYVLSPSGDNFTLSAPIPVGQYIPVYIGWEPGYGYIMLNTTRVSFTWSGNLTITKIGDINDKSATLIDEFTLYDNYVPPDVFLSGSPTAQVVVKTPSYTQTLNITTMDGSSLSNISVSLFSSNWTLLNATSWSFGETPTVFANATGGIFAVITGTASTTIYLQPENGSIAVAIPGNSAQYISATIEPASYPSTAQRVWDWLTVKDVNGRIVYRNRWDFQPTSVVLQVGKAYLIEVSNDNFTETQVVFTGLASPDIKINLPSPGELTLYDNLTTYYHATNDSLQIYYYDPQHITEWIRLEMFDVAGRTLLNVTYPYTNLLNFKTNIVPYRFSLTFYRDGHKVTWSRVVGYVSSGKDNPFFLDRPLTSLIILLMVLFSFDALSSMWAPIVTLVTGVILSIPGITLMPLPLIAFLSTSAFLAFLSKANIQFYSVKQLASQMFVLILLLQVAGGIATVLATQLGIPHDQFGVSYLAEQGKEQLVFWSNYTPQYTSLGAPVPTDAKSFWAYMGAVFNGAKYTFMSLGAPESIANALQVVFWALEASLGLYILLGREV